MISATPIVGTAMMPPPMAHAVRLEPAGASFRIVRPGGVYAVPREPVDDCLHGRWVNPGEVPADLDDRFTRREAMILLSWLRALSNRGGPVAPARTPDGVTIDAAMAALGVNQAGLAAMMARATLGANAESALEADRFESFKTLLSKSRKPVEEKGRPLTEEHRRTLATLVERGAAPAPKRSRKS